jgi:ribonuclease HI
MNSKKTARVRYAERQMVILSPYDTTFVAQLKSTLKNRKWDQEKKAWIVDIGERTEALEVTGKFFAIMEENQPTETSNLIAVKPSYVSLPTDITAEWLAGGKLEIWVDGACVGNPGPGGYGIVFSCNGQKKAKSGGFKLTTNNRMEIMGAIVALETLAQKSKVIIYSDSKYLVEAIMLGWAKRWQLNNWKRNRKNKAINPDLWDRLLNLCTQHDVEFRWVKGHNLQTENEWCDKLAETVARQPNLPVDGGYEPEGDTQS